jgi:hypothetical protein
VAAAPVEQSRQQLQALGEQQQQQALLVGA